MKFTVFTRASRSTASRKCFRNTDPLAPVVATVRFSGTGMGKVSAPRGSIEFRPRKFEDRDAAKASQGARQVEKNAEELDRPVVRSKGWEQLVTVSIVTVSIGCH